MDQQRLFRLAPEAFHLQATYVAGEGWRCTAGLRRQGESWDDSPRVVYDHLTTPELLDVICACGEGLLLIA